VSEVLSRHFDLDAMARIAEAYAVADDVTECLGCDGDGKILVRLDDGDYNIPCPLMSLKCAHGGRMRDEIDALSKGWAKSLPGVPYSFRHWQGDLRSTPAMRGVTVWRYEQYPFLVLHGAHGTGKSFAAAYAIYRIQREKLLRAWKYRPAWGSISPLWVSAYRMTTKEELYEAARTAPVLVLDDLGAEENTPRIKAKILEVVSERHGQRRLTVITMCDDVVDIIKTYGGRMAERILGSSHSVHCGSESLRFEEARAG
jgi:hypothetical protein